MIAPETLFLTATDTTIGFLCQNAERLDRAKGRPSGKPYITALPSLRALRSRTRIPKAHRRRVRRAKRQSFIFPDGRSYRVVRESRHLLLLRRLGWAYSSSANPAGAPYAPHFAYEAADIVVEPLGTPGAPSEILRLGKKRIRKIR
ncbi:Sua5 YciO YrdC YwlC family protein [Nitratifractor sp.]